MSARPLTARQQRFVDEYLVDLNATQAAIRAGYSRKGADVTASKLLGIPRIRTAVDARIAERATRVQVTADDVLRGLLRIANADLRRAFDDSSRMLPLKQLPDDIALAISGVDNEELWGAAGGDDGRTHRGPVGDVRKIRLWDKVKALELLGKHLKMWTERIEGTGADGALTVVVREYTGAGDG